MKFNFQFLICIFVIAFSFCSCSKEDFIEINKEDFSNSYAKSKYAYLDTLNKIKKLNKQIEIKCAKRTVVFEDYSSEDKNVEYDYVGKFKNTNLHLISVKEEDKTSYFLVNSKTVQVELFVGFPIIHGDKLFAVEDGYTDSQRIIQYYNFTKDSIKLIEEFSFVLFDKRINNQNYYFDEDYLYFEDNYKVNSRYFKIEISSLDNYIFKR